ncbi:helix-turn-helix domain-containing protein [Domibacillus aminovorans]|uniref:HTH cro/C1-type domain-containing protein n=1 Tax=Domibacillus aminovorans TaxID=29332 RepID=A0A177L248_9BACI|nr:helix-turn-helix transcriptional regulator [Domibacillus aminovorans]OAH59740.1 hypothetical protein AWH49_03220 [Domibacillus aminovorans]
MIGNRIKQLREKRGYTLTKLAQEAQISKSYLSNLERKPTVNPSLYILSKIAAALGITTDHLIKPEQLIQSETKNEWTEFLHEAEKASMNKVDLLKFHHYLGTKKGG